MIKNELVNLFKEVCSITTPSGSELTVAKWIEMHIKGKGWEVWFDKSGKINGSDSGNMYAYLEVNPNYETVAFSAHMDTVAGKSDNIKVLFDGKTFKSNGKTILGADDRVGICSLVALSDIDKTKLNNNVLLFFPTCEESGKMGSKYFEFNKSKIKYVFNVDGGDLPGTFVYKSLGYQSFTIRVQGLSAHAAQNYDAGKNALLASCELVTKLPSGRNKKEGWTFNIGAIKGGEKTNVVCDFIELKGEIRAFEDKKINELMCVMKNTADKIDKKYGVSTDIYFDPDSYTKPLLGDRDSLITKVCEEASNKLDFEFKIQEAFYCSDANNYSGMGYDTIVVSRGGKNAHSVTEEVDLEDIENTCNLVEQLAILS